MKVILAKDIEKLGKKGEIKDLSDGYVRNYLLPKKMVLQYTPENVEYVKNIEKNEQKRREKEQSLLLEIRTKLEEKSITVPVQLGKDNKFFGSITKEDIIKYVEQETGIKLSKYSILLEEPIKDIGVFPVTVKLTSKKVPDITEIATVKLWIIGK